MLAADRKTAMMPETSIRQTGGSNYRSGSFNMTNRKDGTIVNESISDPLINDPRVSVSSAYGSGGLQVVQIVNGTAGVSLNGTSLQQMKVGGQNRSALVDGGINSPAGESIYGKPYYNTVDDMADANYANATWNNNSGNGQITAFDIPTAASYFKELKFETYFVLTNYAGSNKDKIVGRIDWGYKADAAGNITPMGTPKVISTNQFSKDAEAIIKHDYPNYEIIK